MTSVDDRVVGIKFDNAQFQTAIASTLASLENLNKSLKLDGATKGLNDINAAGHAVQLGHISDAVDGIAHRFEAMSVIAISALATLASHAAMAGLSIAKSLTLDPVKSGLQEYQTNINSIQTILSNTRWQNTGLDDVNAALNTLNEYSDKTIYNFSQMARNIGTFTAAGVKLDVATNAIKGIANLAAVSGSSAEQASSAMYQLSQALATGTLKLIDWNSVVNAGMGGKVFQDALMETARVHGVAIDSMLKDAGSFRATLEQGWLSSDILTETLQKFTGDLSKEQIISMGYTNEQADAIIAMGKDASDAATKVKTVSQLLNTLQESAGSGWAKTWQLIFGDFEEARTLFTSVNDTLGAFVQASADARNGILSDWKELGGRTALIEAIGYAFKALISFLTPIKDAFREIFPKSTGQDLYNITVAIRNFTQTLVLGAETADKIKRTFAGVFAVFGIGYDIAARLIGILVHLFGMFAGADTDILGATASVGDFLVALRAALQTGEGIRKFFQNLEKVLEIPVKILIFLGHLLSTLFDGFDAEGAAQKVVSFTENLGPLGTLADFIVYAWSKMLGVLGKVWDFFQPLADKFVSIFNDVSAAVGGVNFGDLLASINTAALVAFVVTLRNSFGRGGVSGVLSELTSTLSAMQTTLQATTLLEIALAVGVLAVSISILSKINADDLTKALAAIAIMFTQLLASLAILTQLPGNNVIRLYVMAAAMGVLAVAIVILATAVKMLSDLSWEELLKGLAGVVVLLAAITAAAVFMPDGARLISVGVGLLILSAAIKVLASAVKDLSGLGWEEMAKGLAGVGALLLALTLFSRFASANATGVLAGAGIILLAVGIKILASAVQDLSSISWENIGKGMAVLATSLLTISLALDAIPPTAPLQAAGIAIVAASMLILAQAIQSISTISWENVGKGMAVLATSLLLIGAALDAISPTAPLSAAGVFIVAVALVILADALGTLGNMSWESILKGLVTMGVAMAIITVALNLMQGSALGAVAMLIVAGALAVLATVLVTLGNMSWGEIVKGLVALAGVFVVLGLAGAILGSVVPALLGLGVALLLIGAGLALAGAGVFLFAAGLTALGVGGAVAAAAVVAILSAVIGLIPTFVKQVGIALLLLIDILIEGIPKIVELIIGLIIGLLDGLDAVLPKLALVLLKLILLLLVILEEAIPQMYEAGLHILIGILEGIRDNINQIVDTAAQIIENFLRGIGDNIGGIIQAGVDLIFSFIRGMTDAINQNSEALGQAGADLAIAIVNGMVRGLTGAGGRVADAARGVAQAALNAAKNFLGINSPSKEFMYLGEFSGEGMGIGFKNMSGFVAKAAASVGQKALDAMKKSVAGFTSILAQEIDPNPVITPVIDLTAARKSASELWTMLDMKPVSVNSSYSAAKFASNGFDQNQTAANDNSGDPGNGDTIYNQYNNSPKALSTAEIYRVTKNQLSITKGGLPV